MHVGVPSEKQGQEYRIAPTSAGMRELGVHGQSVLVQERAGEGSGIIDSEYRAAGPEISSSAEDVWRNELILKGKEPAESEYPHNEVSADSVRVSTFQLLHGAVRRLFSGRG